MLNLFAGGGATEYSEAYRHCELCPRACGVDRTAGQRGVCGASDVLRVGRAALHWWEEPCLVGDQGSGAVFFSFCPLHCVYCQNQELVQGSGIEISPERLAHVVLRLQDVEGAANINLVTPTHYVPSIAAVLAPLREEGKLHIPVVYNTSSYEGVATLQLMDGLVDVYLADYKYATPDSARRFSHAPDYPRVALDAIEEMLRQAGQWREDGSGMLRQGVIVRHLVLPGRVEDSLRALDALHARFGNSLRLSIMNQYTPLAPGLDKFGLAGTVSAEEYERVLDHADALGFDDYFWQEGGAAEESFVPAFDGTGV